MNSVIRNIIAVIAGLIAGSIVNMAIIMLSNSFIALPEGVDPSNMENLKANMHLFEPKHFLFPFLAHALGTLSGAVLTVIIASSKKLTMVLILSALFLAGGVSNVIMLPAPLWYAVIDLSLAYIPMALMGYYTAKRFKK